MCSICTPHVVNFCNMSENMSHLPFSSKPYLSYMSVNMSVTIWPCGLNISATYQPHINETQTCIIHHYISHISETRLGIFVHCPLVRKRCPGELALFENFYLCPWAKEWQGVHICGHMEQGPPVEREEILSMVHFINVKLFSSIITLRFISPYRSVILFFHRIYSICILCLFYLSIYSILSNTLWTICKHALIKAIIFSNLNTSCQTLE